MAKKWIEGTAPKFFLAAVAFTAIAAILYFRSEALGGWDNVAKGKALEKWALITCVPAIACWILMFTSAKRNKK